MQKRAFISSHNRDRGTIRMKISPEISPSRVLLILAVHSTSRLSSRYEDKRRAVSADCGLGLSCGSFKGFRHLIRTLKCFFTDASTMPIEKTGSQSIVSIIMHLITRVSIIMRMSGLYWCSQGSRIWS